MPCTKNLMARLIYPLASAKSRGPRPSPSRRTEALTRSGSAASCSPRVTSGVWSCCESETPSLPVPGNAKQSHFEAAARQLPGKGEFGFSAEVWR